MGLSSPGVGSGLDVKGIVDALVQSEISPALNRIQKQNNSFKAELSALGQLTSILDKLSSSMGKLSDITQFYKMKGSLSDSDNLSVTINSKASASTYQVEVKALAQRHSLASSAFADATSSVGSGSMTIEFGTYSADKSSFTANADKAAISIDIAAGSDNLNAIRDAINNKKAGVTASIVTDADGARLTLTSTDTGKDFAMKVSVVDDDANSTDAAGLSSFAYDPTLGINSMTETMAAQNSLVKVNGIDLSNPTNTLDKSIEGVTLNLKKAEIGKLVTLTVEDNKGQLTSMVNDFIKNYNESISALTQLTGYNSETQKGGLLQGDAGLRTLKLNLSKWVSEPIAIENNPLQTLRDIGIKTNDKGQLEMDQTKFDEVLASNYEDIGALFAKSAQASDGNVRINEIGTDVKAGKYSLILDEYTAGVSMSGTLGGLSATSSDGIKLKGSGALKSLAVDVLAGSAGNRGTITVSDGLAVGLKELLDTYLGKEGNLTQRTENLTERLDDLEDDNERLELRASKIEQRYLRQFTALDTMIMQMNNMSDFLKLQLDNLPKISLNRK